MIEQRAYEKLSWFWFLLVLRKREETLNLLFDHYSYVCHFYLYRLMILTHLIFFFFIVYDLMNLFTLTHFNTNELLLRNLSAHQLNLELKRN